MNKYEFRVEMGEDMKIQYISDPVPMVEIIWGKADGSGFDTCTHLPSNYKNHDSIIVPKWKYADTGNIWSQGVDFG